MSYDLAIYAPRMIEPADLRALISDAPGLQLETESPDDARSLVVVRGARRRYCFTIDGPDSVEPEDVPVPVTSAVLDATRLYNIVVEGSPATEIPHAIRFARRLAKALEGAVLDQQIDEVWSRSRSRSVERPAREERVDVVELNIYCLRSALTAAPDDLFLDTVRRFLPEALPRRFGEYEPLQGKFADVGSSGFRAAWAASTTTLFTAGSAPCIGGSLDAGPLAAYPSSVWKLGLSFHTGPLRDSRWRAALRHLLVALADGLPSFYASVQVTGGHIWSGRSMWTDSATEWSVSPARAHTGWLGLPPDPTWWAWFGEPYRDLVRDHLDPERCTETQIGILHEWADEPVKRADLSAEPSNWVPQELRASFAPNPNRQLPLPLHPATAIPRALQSI